MPSKDAIREVQQQATAGLGAMDSGALSFTTPVGLATKDNEDWSRVGLVGRDVLWVPEQAKETQTAAHGMRSHEERWKPGDRGGFAAATRVHCSLFRMEVYVTEFVKQCLHCMESKAGEKVPRTLVETVHERRPGEVLHFDILVRWRQRSPGQRWIR